MIPRPPVSLDPAFDDPRSIHALLDAQAPYAMLQARGQVMASDLEQAAITGAPIRDEMIDAARGDARASLRLSATFRGYWASADAGPDAAIESLFEHPRFLDAARRLHGGAAVVRPTEIYAHVIVPHRQHAPGAHVDLPSFRGIGRRELPVWLLVTMRRSGLFERWRIPVATAVCWLYRGPGGTFTYWPEGPDAPPRSTAHPFDNTAIVGENDSMFHRGDPVGAGDREIPPGLSVRSTLGPDPARPDRWQVREGERVLAEYARDEVRFALSWSAQVFRDAAQERVAREHADDLDLETVIGGFLGDLERRGTPVERPHDPLHDPDWIALLGRTYRMVPRLDPLAARA